MRFRVNSLAWAASCLGLSACSDVSAPEDNVRSTAPAWATSAEVVLEVDVGRQVAVVVREGHALGQGAVPVELMARAVRVSGVGVGAPAGLRRVRISLGLSPTRSGVVLAPSSMVAAPPGQRGVTVIPHDAAVVPDTGGVQVVGGPVLEVELPSRGRVTPSADFDGDGAPGGGAPFPFFASRRCPAAAPNGACYRYETLPAGSSAAREVGFDVEPQVRRFRVRLLVAADRDGW